jgi:hypothetical protein
MSRIRFSENEVTKCFDSQNSRNREADILNRLSHTPISGLVPKVTGLSELEEGETKQYLISMSRIAGVPLSDHALDEGVVEQLASVLASCHQLFKFTSFGSLTSDLQVEDSQSRFGDFLILQLRQWNVRLARFSTQYAEVSTTLTGLLDQQHSSLNRFTSAVFCHNDFDLKNVLHVQGKITGLIDWEHAGAYPFAWDMRKLYPVLYWKKPGWGSLFLTRYLSQCPNVVIPSVSEQALLVAVDCIGALSWAYRNRAQSEANRISQLLNQALAMLSEGVSNE